MMKIFYFAGVVGLISAVVAGCAPPSPPEPTPAPIQFTHHDLCESLVNLYTDKFHATDVSSRSTTTGDLNEPIWPNSTCEVFAGADEEFYGNVGLRHAPGEPNSIGVLRPEYVETTIDGETVLVFNQLLESKYSAPAVFIAATIDGWFGKMWIEPRKTRTAKGPMGFTEADQKNAAEFLIDTLRRTARNQA